MFLARQSYRRRRLADAARLLPFLAAFLFLLPILWGPGPGGGRATAADGIYLVLAWAALILGAFLMARALSRAQGEAPHDGEGRIGEGPGGRAE